MGYYTLFIYSFFLQILYYVQDSSRPTPNNTLVLPLDTNRLTRIYQSLDPRANVLRVSYVSKHNAAGRFYPIDTDHSGVHPSMNSPVGSIIQVSKRLRSTLFKKHGYLDFDLVRAHSSILIGIGNILTIDTPGLQEYVSSPTSIQQIVDFFSADNAHPLTEDQAKKLLVLTLYGGGLSSWITDMRESHVLLRNTERNAILPVFYSRLKTEVTYIRDSLFASNGHLIPAVHQALPVYKRKLKVVHAVICTIENFVCNTALNFCISQGVVPTKDHGHQFVWGWDGFSFIPNRTPAVSVDGLVAGMNDLILRTCGPPFSFVRFVSKGIPDLMIPAVLDDNHELWRSNEFRNFGVEDVVGPVPEKRDLIIHYSDKPYSTWRTWFEEDKIKIEHDGFLILYYRSRNGALDHYEEIDEATMKSRFRQYAALICDPKKNDGSMIKKSKIVDTWLLDPYMRMKDYSMMYPPPLHCPDNTFNLWTESPYHDTPLRIGEVERDGDIELFLRLVRAETGIWNMQDASPMQIARYEYVLYYLADMIQRPAIKPGVIIVFGGSEGTGKSLLAAMCGNLVGPSRFVTTSMQHLIGDFNHLLQGKILVCINECPKTQSAEHAALFKTLLTDATITVSRKHKDPFQSASYHRFIATTNDVGIIRSERRPFYLCSTLEFRMAENKPTLDRLWGLLKSEEGMCAVYRYLETINLMERFHLPTEDAILEPPTDERNRTARIHNEPTTTFAAWLARVKFANQLYFRLSDLELHELWVGWATSNSIANGALLSVYNVVQGVCHKISWLPGSVGESHVPHTHIREFNAPQMRATLDVLLGTRADNL